MTSLGLGINGARLGQAAPGWPLTIQTRPASPYFVTMRIDGGGSAFPAGDIAKVSHTFQPSGRFSEANSL